MHFEHVKCSKTISTNIVASHKLRDWSVSHICVTPYRHQELHDCVPSKHISAGRRGQPCKNSWTNRWCFPSKWEKQIEYSGSNYKYLHIIQTHYLVCMEWSWKISDPRSTLIIHQTLESKDPKQPITDQLLGLVHTYLDWLILVIAHHWTMGIKCL